MNQLGIMLANGEQDISRVQAVGFDHYLALEYQAAYLLQCTGEKYIRLDERGIYNDLNSIANKCRACRYLGIKHILPWNEQNIPNEGNYGRLPIEQVYRTVAANFLKLKELLQDTDIILHFPAWSPSNSYRECLRLWHPACAQAAAIDVHAYGNCAEMLEIIDWYLSVIPTGDLYITEWNFAAGRKVDPFWYAQEAVRFLQELMHRPRVKAAFGFIWKWYHADSVLQSTLDWVDQPIEVAVRNMPKTESVTLNVTSVPSPNYGYPTGKLGRLGHEPVAIVNHIAQGSRAGLISTFNNEASQRSSNYTVCKSGEIICWVAEENAAYANGIDFDLGFQHYKSDMTVPWIADCWRDKVNPNLVTISIELEGLTGEPLTEAQYASLLALHKDIFARRKWDVTDIYRIVGHFQIDSVNKPNCPGTGMPWARLRKDLGMQFPTTFPTDDVKKKVLEHYDMIWGYCTELEKTATDLRKQADNSLEVARVIKERIVATKRDLGL